MKYINLLLIAVMAISFASCGNVKDITVGEVRQAKLKTMTGSTLVIEIEAQVNNPTGHRLTVRKGEFDVERRGYAFAEASLKEKLIIPARSSNYHSMLIEIKVLDIFSMLAGGGFNKILDELTLTGYLKGGTSLYSKKYRFENIKLNELGKFAIP